MTIKCINCDSEAAYTLADPGVNAVDYCQDCLPQPMHLRAARGEMTLRPEPTSAEPKAKKEK